MLTRRSKCLDRTLKEPQSIDEGFLSPELKSRTACARLTRLLVPTEERFGPAGTRLPANQKPLYRSADLRHRRVEVLHTLPISVIAGAGPAVQLESFTHNQIGTLLRNHINRSLIMRGNHNWHHTCINHPQPLNTHNS